MQPFHIAGQMTQSAFRVSKNAQVFAKHSLHWLREGRPSPAIRLRQLCEELGATYIKMGQFIASTPSFFPPEYVEAFQDCLDKTPPLPFHTIQKVIEQELGGPLTQFYTKVEPIPLASASIGQVHAATTRQGFDVVIKVQKPGVENILRTDLGLVHASSLLLEKILPQMRMTSISAICQEMKQGMLQECDFLAELNHLEEFRHFLASKGIENVVAPQPYPELSTRKILTMERLYGTPFTDLTRVAHLTADPEVALIAAMNAWFATLLEGHHFHADVHAGNLLVLENGKVAFIDFGIVGRVKTQTWASVQQLVTGIMSQDFTLMAQALYGIGMTEQYIEIADLAQDIQRIFTQQQLAPNDTLADQNKTLMAIMQTAKNYGIHFPREFALLLKQLLYFDRYVQLISPSAQLYDNNALQFF